MLKKSIYWIILCSTIFLLFSSCSISSPKEVTPAAYQYPTLAWGMAFDEVLQKLGLPADTKLDKDNKITLENQKFVQQEGSLQLYFDDFLEISLGLSTICFFATEAIDEEEISKLIASQNLDASYEKGENREGTLWLSFSMTDYLTTAQKVVLMNVARPMSASSTPTEHTRWSPESWEKFQKEFQLCQIQLLNDQTTLIFKGGCSAMYAHFDQIEDYVFSRLVNGEAN